jgi:lambda family phage tail tape measure protein
MDDFNLDLEFSASGADVVEGLLGKVYDGTAKVVEGNENLVESSAKVAKASQLLSQQIDRAILSYADSKSQVLEYTAAQLGQTEALGAQLSMLKEMETHEKEATQAFAERAQQLKQEQSLEQDLARDVQRRLKEEQAAQDALAKSQAAAAKERQAAAARELAEREAYYASIVSAAQAAELAQANARHAAILATQKAAAEYIAINAAQEKEAVALAEKQAIEEIAWANKSLKERIRILQELQAYQANGAISPTTTATKFGSAAANDLPNLSKLQAAYTEEVKKTTSAHGDLHASGQSVAQMWDNVSLNTSRARTEVVVLAHEMVQGRFSRIPGSLMVFAEYSNLSTLATSAFGLAVLGTAASVGTLLVAMAKGSLEFDKVNAALIQTGGYSGITTAGFYSMSTALAKANGTIGEAKETLLDLAGSGRFTFDQINTIAPAIVQMARDGGVAVEALVKQFEELAKDPVSASKQLNEQYHYLTASIYEQIRALVEQGDKLGAANLAETTYAEATKSRAEELERNLGLISRAWHAVAAAASGAWNSMMAIGRPTNVEDKLKAIGQQIIDSNAKIANYNTLGGKDSGNGIKEQNQRLVQLWAEQTALIKEKDDAQLAQKKKAQKARMEQDAINAQDIRASEEKKNFTPLQKRQSGEAKIYQGDATELANALPQDQFDKLGERAKLSSHATQEEIYNNAKDYYNKVLALSKESGAKLLISEESTNQRIENVELKRHDKKVAKIKENSNVDFSLYEQEQARAYSAAAKSADKAIQLDERTFTSHKKTLDDGLVAQRADGSAMSALHIASTDIYVKYLADIKAARDIAANDEKDQLDKKLAAKDAEIAATVAKAESQVRVTVDGQAKLTAAIAKGKQDRANLANANNEQKGAIDSRTADVNAEAQSKAAKDSITAIDAQIQAMNKLNVAKAKQAAAFGLSKEQIRRQAEDAAALVTQQIKQGIAEEKMAKDKAGDDQVAIALYDAKIQRMETLLEASKKQAEYDATLKARQGDWVKGAQQGLVDYQDTSDNVFKIAQSSVAKSFKGMEDSLVTFATTGKLSVSSLANSIISDLARIAIQKGITGPLSSSLGTLFSSVVGGLSGGGGAAAGFDYAKTFANGGSFDNGAGLSAYSGSIVSTPTQFKFASGAGLMGEAGPEAILPLRRGSDGKLGISAPGAGDSNGTTIVTVNVDAGSTGVKGDDTKSNAFGLVVANIVRSTILKEKLPGGTLAKS